MQEVAQIVWYIFLVLIGVNALIIVHEFGHFIVARMCGVRCDKFYIWFDIYGLRFFRFKWGNTEYGLGILPLGGYVKMFGQEDNPGQIAKEIEKARQIADRRQQAAEISGEEESLLTAVYSQPSVEAMAEALYAKDSYLSKSVPQRMAIISAGVIANLIFAVICATAAFMVGFTQQPCVVGALVPGSPAWVAGLQIGDRIVTADGKELKAFAEIMDALVDGDAENGVRLTIERPGEEKPIEKVIVASKREGALIPSIGIISGRVTELFQDAPLSADLKKTLPEDVVASLQENRRLVAINDQPIESYADIVRIQETFADQPLTYKFQGGSGKTVVVEVPPVPMKELGIRFQMGEITAVRQGYASEQARIKPGGTLVGVGTGDLETFDPLKLPQILAKRAINEPESVIPVKIDEIENGPTIALELPLVVHHENLYTSSPGDAVACSALGIAYNVKNVVAGVDPDVFANIPIGAVVESVEFPDFVPDFWLSKASFLKVFTEKGFWTKGFQFVDVGKKVQLPFILDNFVQIAPEGTKVRLHTTFEGESAVYSLVVRKSNDWFNPNRGFNFGPEEFVAKAESFGQAVQLGFDKTVYGTLAVYRFLSNIGGKVSAKAMGGPVTIVTVAYRIASQGFGPYLIFLCIIGANLAVLNILPIPVLDGGHLVFLTYEAIFRKPPNETVQIGLSYIGLLMILGLMAWAISLDVGLISRF